MSYGFEDSKYVIKNVIPKNLMNYKVLDIGCGLGFWGWALRTHTKGVFYLVGLEVNPLYIKKLSDLRIYDEIINTNVITGLEKIPNYSYDLIIASHVIEHMDKKDGWKVIDELIRICKKQMIILLPHRGSSNYEKTKCHDSYYNYHRSAWSRKDFELNDIWGFKIFKVQVLPYTHRSGRATVLFEKIWNTLKGRKVGGSLIVQYPKNVRARRSVVNES